MKKILSGYFFRAVKSVELWVCLVLIFFISFFTIGTPSIGFQETLREDYQLTDTVEVTYEKAESFRNELDHVLDSKISTLIDDVEACLFFPAFIIPVFTVLFTGRMFTAGAIRNLIASGHSKTKVYLSSLIFSASVAALFNVLSLLSLSAALVIHRWKIPVFFPMLGAYVMYMFLLDLIFLSVALSILFVSQRPVVSLIALAGVIGILFTGSSMLSIYALMIPERYVSGAKVQAYKEEHPESDPKMDWTFDIKNFQDEYTFTDHGEPIDSEPFLGPKAPNHVDGTTRKVLVVSAYANPATGALMTLVQIMSRYKMWKEGLYTFLCVINFSWVVVINAAGLIVFRRKELN